MLSTLWKPCVRFFLLFTLVCGVLYTGSVTILAQLFFPAQANGSLVEKDGVVVGSTAIGQPFKDDDHLWGRPASIDVTSFQDEFGQPLVYGAPANHVRSDSAYQQDLSTKREDLAVKLGVDPKDVPADLLASSASGLDPDISPKAAKAQVKRIAQAKGISEKEVQNVIDACTSKAWLGLFGEDRVNVLEVNLKLDEIGH